MGITDNGNIISVTGYGRLFIEPNFLTIYISLGCRSNTMKASLDGVNIDMKRLFEIVKTCKIAKRYVHIVDLDFGPKYEWKKDERQFVGYEANQKNIELNATEENEEKAKNIISDITSLNYLIDCNIQYGLKDETILFEKNIIIMKNNSFDKTLFFSLSVSIIF